MENMKNTMNMTYLTRAFQVLAIMGALTGCVMDYGDCLEDMGGDGRLSVAATVSDGTLVTRTASVVDLKEKDIQTLDVFVEHVTGTTGDGTFMKQYHLTAEEGELIPEKVNNWLANNWRAEGLKIGQKYNIYVATNNTQTAGTVANVTALKALVADEVTDGVAIINDDNDNVTWGETTTSGNIYKLYDANPGSYRALTSDKKFMMDGVLENWTPTANSRDQVFKPVTLNRAAAKIVLNVNFGADFLKSLTHDKKIVDGTETWVEKPAAEKVTITGSPAWKFYNFAFGAPVFAPATQGEGVEVHNSDFNIFHNQSYTGDDKHFTITTYTYPNKWTQANYATDAPSLVISVGFTQGTGDAAVTNYHYYRIPLVKKSDDEYGVIERNHIYVINATISTAGSATQEDQDVTEDIEYAVLPWNDVTNSEVIENNVESIQHYYFNVNPKVYTLRGDGDQSVVLNYSKATGTKVNWKLFTYDEDGNQTAVVANNASGAVRAWFYDADGDFNTTYGDSNQNPWPNMGVTITQSNEGTSGSKGTVTVTSTALTNKAIKYIRLRVYLDEEATFQDGVETMYEDIIIRHFPTDNIQSITGNWSSYHDPDQSSSTTIHKTRSLAEAQSLAEQYNVTFTSEEIETTDVIDYATYTAHSSEAGYAIEGPETRTRQQFSQAITSNDNRRNANSQANAILSDGWYYWGVNPSTTNNQNQADYYITTGNWWNPTTTYYAYQTRYRARYTHTYTYTEYTLELPIASTGDWVDWDASDKANHTGQRTYQINYTNGGSQFIAKVYDNGIYRITESSLGGGRYATQRGTNEGGLTNNHMYVIQISSTSDTYVLGRPYVNQTTHQSNDNVVSPAFMIASQLGAVLPFTGDNGPANAATHCSRYMEVSGGIRYTGWRLPTEAEIKVITGYQYGTIEGITIPAQYQALTPVLTGMYYHSLSGTDVLANPNAGQGSTTRSYLRCVRDLSAEEVERLNGFDKIQEKYR